MKRYPKGVVNLPKNFPFTKFKIIVPTERDKKEIVEACEHLHDAKGVDTDFVTVNQLVHEYEHGDKNNTHSNIIVNPSLYKLSLFYGNGGCNTKSAG